MKKKAYEKAHNCERCGTPLTYDNVRKVQFLEMRPNSNRTSTRNRLTPHLMFNIDLCIRCQMLAFEGVCKVVEAGGGKK